MSTPRFAFRPLTFPCSGHLRPIAPKYLSTILELLLNSLISLGLPHTAAPIDELVDTLADEHEIARQVSRQVMGWFGEVSNGKWKMDVGSVVKEVGLGILRNHRVSKGVEVPLSMLTYRLTLELGRSDPGR